MAPLHHGKLGLVMIHNPNKPTRQEKLAYLDRALVYVKRWNTAVDAGAHIGLWTQVMADKFARVLAFEPMPDNCETWRENMRGRENAVLYQEALGDVCGTVRMDGTGHSKHFAVIDNQGTVPMVTIDSLNLEALDFLKVDCEGADYLVLKGGEKTIKKFRPVVIVESKAKFEARYGLKPYAPVSFMKELGAKNVESHWHDHIFSFDA